MSDGQKIVIGGLVHYVLKCAKVGSNDEDSNGVCSPPCKGCSCMLAFYVFAHRGAGETDGIVSDNDEDSIQIVLAFVTVGNGNGSLQSSSGFGEVKFP